MIRLKRYAYTILLLTCITLTGWGCKKDKEGLSAVTGNLEIDTKALSNGASDYNIYTEDQYILFLSNQFAVPFFKGNIGNGYITTIKGLRYGNYGIRVYGGGSGWHKPISIVPNKMNKIAFP